MKIYKAKISKQSLISAYLPANYSDSYECETACPEDIVPDDLQITFWTKFPRWIESLFKVRNLLVKPFGLKSGDDDSGKLAEAIRKGGSYGLMTVVSKTSDETVVCLDDKHLKAYMSFRTDAIGSNRKRISLSTVVHFHYWLGYVYFYSICPFHHIVVKRQLMHTLKNI